MPENRRRFRNPVARSPLLRKGGPHQISRSGERRNQRQALEAELDSWRDKIEDLEWQNEEPVPKGTDSSYRVISLQLPPNLTYSAISLSINATTSSSSHSSPPK